MPEINHKNLGTIQEHAYLEGLIISVDRTEDTASVVVLEFGARLDDVPVFYHCDPLAPIRENGAIRDGAKGFVAGDKVILLCELNTAQLNQERIKNVCVIGHMAGAKKCAYNYILVRASKNALKQIKAGETYPGEECIIYDVQEEAMAVIATGEGETLSMPCPVNNALPFLENIKFQGVSLYEEFPQGSDVVFEEAGYTPEWTEDLNGDDIRGSIEAKEWWDTYDPNGNPVMEMFEDMTFGVMNDTDGSYSKVESILQEHEEKIAQWDENSNSFGQDFREYPIKGSVDLKVRRE
ncbi:MAG: hypothetical protein B6I31_03265 [Desulfobacteraceae bacterium 4572_19]|nr:MAG: hypothetical protein B6I31_03265 [Desulfobacteraceae bacterium 4572_19]